MSGAVGVLVAGEIEQPEEGADEQEQHRRDGGGKSQGYPSSRPHAQSRCLTNRASAAGARFAGAPRARSFYATRQAHKRNSSLLGRARQLQALVRRQPFKDVGTDSALL